MSGWWRVFGRSRVFGDFQRSSTLTDVTVASVEAPIVYISVTAAGGLALIVSASPESGGHSDRHRVPTVWLDELTDSSLQAMVFGSTADVGELGGYLEDYARRYAEPFNEELRVRWLGALDQTLNWLWRVLMGPVTAELETVTAPSDDSGSPPEAVLIPSGLLGLLPLHAAWSEDPACANERRYVLDNLVVRYAPNAVSLRERRHIAEKVQADRLLAVIDPQPVGAFPLDHAAEEGLSVLACWPEEARTSRWHVAAMADVAGWRPRRAHYGAGASERLGPPCSVGRALSGVERLGLVVGDSRGCVVGLVGVRSGRGRRRCFWGAFAGLIRPLPLESLRGSAVASARHPRRGARSRTEADSVLVARIR